ncbi:MAG: helix-turn-helix domain-containing protein [Acidimicrobiales bacterium]
MGDDLAAMLRDRRRELGLSQVALARRAGISAGYLSRLEGGAWEQGGPWPSDKVLRALARALGLSSTRLIEARCQARGEGRARTARLSGPDAYTVVIGNDKVYEAVRGMVARNPRGGSLRTVDAYVLDYPAEPAGPEQLAFWEYVGDRLAGEPDTILYRVCASTAEYFPLIRAKTDKLAGGRDPASIGNVRTRFCFRNPLAIDVVIGEQEAFIGLPDRKGHPHLRAGIVIDDPDLITALREWYDEFVWESTCDCTDIRPASAHESLDRVAERLREE